MRNQEILISTIMNTAPYQLPPIIHGNGVYSLDITYLGQKLHKIGVSMEEVLESYLDFVTKTTYIKGGSLDAVTSAPIRPGSTVYPKRASLNQNR